MSGALSGKRILVTGAAAGIGLGIARACAEAGASLIVADINHDALIASTGKLVGPTATCETRALDVASSTSIHRLFDELHGPVDGLVNNAGITIEGDFLGFHEEDLERLWQTNLRSVFLVAQHAARRMAKHGGGAIVNIASNHASASTPGYEMYAATKSGIVAMTRAMSWSLGRHRIRVNALSPGLTRTEKVAQLADDNPALADRFRTLHADGDYATVDEIGQIAAFLMSDHAAAVTGTEIVADHGLQALLCHLDDLKADEA